MDLIRILKYSLIILLVIVLLFIGFGVLMCCAIYYSRYPWGKKKKKNK